MVTRWMPIFLRRWKGTILVTSALVMAAGTVLAFSAPRVLESRAMIYIDQTAPAGPAPNDSARRRKTLETLETERRVILSRATAEAVVFELGPALRPRTTPTGLIGETLDVVGGLLVGPNGLSERERAIRRIASGLRVGTNANSSMLTIRFADQDPDVAKSVVAATTREYVNRRLGANAGPDPRAYYARKLEDLRQRHAQLNALRGENPVTAIGEDRSRLVLDSKALRTRIAELKRDLQSRRDQPEQVSASSISRLRDEVRVVGSGLERLGSQIDRLGSEIELTQNLGFMIDTAEQQLIDYQAKFAAAPVRPGAIELINVEVVQRATDPVASRFPNLRYLFVAAFIALAAGLLAAFLRQILGGQIRSAAQVEEILALPVYGTLGKYQPS